MPDMAWQFAGVVGVHRDHPLIVWTVCVLCTSHGNGRLCVNENEWGAEIVLESASLSGQPPLPPRLSLLCMPWNLSVKNFCTMSVSIQLHWCRRNDDDHQNYAKALTLIRMCLHAKRHKRSSMYVAHSLYLFGILVSRHGLVLFGLPCHSTSLHTTQYSLRICLIIIKYNSVRAATMWVHSGERTLSDSGAIFYCTPRYEHVLLLLLLLVCRPR